MGLDHAPSSELPAAFEGLEPAGVWEHFGRLTQIPRKSGHETAVMRMLAVWGGERGCTVREDTAGNMCVHVPATEGCEELVPVCLQGHSDMVCKPDNDPNFDHLIDPITPVREGNLIIADGTSLGADNGIGLAAAMAIVDDPDTIHPPLELLITIGEETGFDGARALDVEALGMKSETLINLDNEQDGEVCVESAGLRMSSATKKVEREEGEVEGSYYELSVENLPGGHSAKNIADNIPNAIKLVSGALAVDRAPVRLVSIDGGAETNSIPTNCKVVVFVPKEAQVDFSMEQVRNYISRVTSDPLYGGKVELRELAPEEVELSVMTAETHGAIMDALYLMEDGVRSMHPTYNGLPFTSSNLGTIETTGDSVSVRFSVRSPEVEEVARVSGEISEVLKGKGFKVDHGLQIATWNADQDSQLVGDLLQAYKDTTGNSARLGATHGGLEGGTVTQALEAHLGKSVASAAIGPEINNPHSTSECLDIDTVPRFYGQLKRALELAAIG
jgi:dipeptidase D